MQSIAGAPAANRSPLGRAASSPAPPPRPIALPAATSTSGLVSPSPQANGKEEAPRHKPAPPLSLPDNGPLVPPDTMWETMAEQQRELHDEEVSRVCAKLRQGRATPFWWLFAMIDRRLGTIAPSPADLAAVSGSCPWRRWRERLASKFTCR